MRKPGDFCPKCQVHVSLHPSGDRSPEDCEHAEIKAASLERIGRVLIPSAYGHQGGGGDAHA